MRVRVRSIGRWAAVLGTCLMILLIPVWTGALKASDETSEPRFLTFDLGAGARPDECGGRFVTRSVDDFFAAINRGDRTAIDSAVASGSRFRVYSQTQRYGSNRAEFFSSKSRDEVIAHLVKRQAKDDRYRARALDRNGYDRAFEICNLGFVIERRIGGGPWRPFVGKGALDWPSGAIAVWNVGGQCGSPSFPCPRS